MTLGKAVLTEKNVTAFQWRGKRTIIWDREQRGFGILIWGSGDRGAYIAQSKRHGKSYRATLGKAGVMKLADARIEAAKHRGLVKSGQDPNADTKAANAAWTLDDAMNYYRGTVADARQHSAEYRDLNERAYDHHTPT